MTEKKPGKDLLTEQEAAKLLGITLRTLQNMVYSGRMPPHKYVKAVTGKRFYHRDRLFTNIY